MRFASTRAGMLAAGAAAALATSAGAQQESLNVLATVAMVADIAQSVAGDCAVVTSLLGPGSDPHLYRATAADVNRLAGADLILYVDPALEAQLAEVLAGFADRTATLGLARAAFGDDALLTGADTGQIDPHLWMDVSRWAQIAPVVAAAIAAQRPDCADAMAGRVARLTAELDALHGWIAAAIASIPEEQRLLVTAHDAFYYFADAYGIAASEAVQGISTQSEASIADIREVAAFVVERATPAVFVETSINPRTMEALVAEARSLGHEVVIGGALYSDAMGDAGTPEGTYIGMMRANTLAITGALGGSAPDWPEALADWAGAWNTGN